MKSSNTKQPTEAIQRILGWHHCEQAHGAETLRLRSPDGDEREVTLSRGNLRILKTLQRGPVFCASPVRLSDRILVLKRDFGVNIRTDMFSAGSGSNRESYGTNTLLDTVLPSHEGAAK